MVIQDLYRGWNHCVRHGNGVGLHLNKNWCMTYRPRVWLLQTIYITIDDAIIRMVCIIIHIIEPVGSLVSIIGKDPYQDRLGKGPFKCYIMQMGVGGCKLFREKALRRSKVQRY